MGRGSTDLCREPTDKEIDTCQPGVSRLQFLCHYLCCVSRNDGRSFAAN